MADPRFVSSVPGVPGFYVFLVLVIRRSWFKYSSVPAFHRSGFNTSLWQHKYISFECMR